MARRHLPRVQVAQAHAVVDVPEDVHLHVAEVVPAPPNHLRAPVVQVHVAADVQEDVLPDVLVDALVGVQVVVPAAVAQGVALHARENAKGNVLVNVPQVATVAIVAVVALVAVQVHALALVYNTALGPATIHVMTLVPAHAKHTAVWAPVRE